jgi:hypothetical protein
MQRSKRPTASGYGAPGTAPAWRRRTGTRSFPCVTRAIRRPTCAGGIADFLHRFGRLPKGMWLAETACDTPALEALARNGIAFTVLAPHQALKVRARGGRWHDARGGKIDPRRPYLVNLPSGRSITVFFYDGPASRGVAFERLLEDGNRFRDRLTSLFDPRFEGPQLAHIATDGESYGHHHRFGEMGLAYALESLEQDPHVILTIYEEFLAHHPPSYEAAIIEGSSWSCAHGIERWRSDCGCSTGAEAGWNQAWRAPLRQALDWLRDAVNARWEPLASEIFLDCWGARDRYVELLLDPSADARERFLSRELRTASDGPLHADARIRALELLELQRHLILQYTSCGWFFADLGGLETVQILRYAARALELATSLFGTALSGEEFEPAFVSRLARAHCNRPEDGDGAALFRREVAPSAVDLGRAAAHFAARSLFEPREGREGRDGASGFEVRFIDRVEERAGRARLGTGHFAVSVRRTTRTATFDYAAVHLGDHNLGGGIRPAGEASAAGDAAAMREQLATAFRRFELPEVLRTLERHFAGRTFSLRSLFFDEQARVLRELLEGTRHDIDHAYEALYDEHAPLMRYLASLGQEPPLAMRHAASCALSARLAEALAAREPNVALLRGTTEEAKTTGATLDSELLTPAITLAFERLLGANTLASLDTAIVLAELLVVLHPDAHLRARTEEALVRTRDLARSDAGRVAPDGGPRALRIARLGELLRVSV